MVSDQQSKNSCVNGGYVSVNIAINVANPQRVALDVNFQDLGKLEDTRKISVVPSIIPGLSADGYACQRDMAPVPHVFSW